MVALIEPISNIKWKYWNSAVYQGTILTQGRQQMSPQWGPEYLTVGFLIGHFESGNIAFYS